MLCPHKIFRVINHEDLANLKKADVPSTRFPFDATSIGISTIRRSFVVTHTVRRARTTCARGGPRGHQLLELCARENQVRKVDAAVDDCAANVWIAKNWIAKNNGTDLIPDIFTIRVLDHRPAPKQTRVGSRGSQSPRNNSLSPSDYAN
jgi:hypothetical protein